MCTRKQSAEILVAAFTDHNAAVVKIQGSQTTVLWGRIYWKLNATLLQGEGSKDKLKQQWDSWKTKQHKYSSLTQWWEMYVKKEIKIFFRREGRERAREERGREDFYYSCIYDLLQKPSDYPKLNEKLKYFKAKIVTLNGRQITNLQADLRENVSFKDEQLSLYHVINVHKRRKKTASNRNNGPRAQQTFHTRRDQKSFPCGIAGKIYSNKGECGRRRRGLLRGNTVAAEMGDVLDETITNT